MSVESWKTEFCLNKTDLDQYIGLRSSNLKKHKCFNKTTITTYKYHEKIKWFLVPDKDILSYKIVYDKNSKNQFEVTALTRMLCQMYYNKKAVCQECPLFKSLKKPCYADGMPLDVYVKTGNPEPMIEALSKIQKELPQRNERVNE